MPTIIMNIPEEVVQRFNKAKADAYELDADLFEVFWDDVVTAMENRLKVLKK